MLRGQPAGPSISVARAESRKRDDRRTSDQNKEARERVKALSLSRRRKTRPKHGTRCVFALRMSSSQTHQQPGRTKSHSARRRPKNWTKRDSAAGADVSLSQSCVVVPSNGAESERQTPFFSVRFGSTDRLGWRGPPPSRGCSARRLVRGRDFNLVLEREHRTAPNNEQTRAELMAVSSFALGRPPLLRRPMADPGADTPNSPRNRRPPNMGLFIQCASPCNPGKRSAILVGEAAATAGRKSACSRRHP
jgi:hypothetical protein